MTAYLNSLTDFKALLEFTDSDNDAKLNYLQDRIYQRFELFLGRLLEKVERTEVVRVKGAMIPLKALPIDTGETITVIKTTDFTNGATTETLAAKDYEVTEYGLLLGSDLLGSEKLTVTYTGGYVKDGNDVLTFLDEDNSKIISEAANVQLTHEWNKRFKPEAESVTTDFGTVETVPLSLLKDVKNMLQPLRHPRFWWFY